MSKQMRGSNMKNHQLDPFIENDFLASRADDMEFDEGTLRFTKTKAVLKKQGSFSNEGDDEIEMVKRRGERHGDKFDIKICTWQHRKVFDTERCDLGHDHPRIKVEKMWLETFSITHKEARALAKWILNQTGDE